MKKATDNPEMQGLYSIFERRKFQSYLDAYRQSWYSFNAIARRDKITPEAFGTREALEVHGEIFLSLLNYHLYQRSKVMLQMSWNGSEPVHQEGSKDKEGKEYDPS